jgi:vitamin B12 transporter
MDARVSYKLKNSSIYADASNIFDVSYIQAGAVPLPGVWATLGYKFSL